jgi:hypothetical protein
MNTKSLDLDVDSPEKVPGVLRAIANKYYESVIELQSAWQDKNAGKIWEDYARILERAANSCEKALNKRFGR